MIIPHPAYMYGSLDPAAILVTRRRTCRGGGLDSALRRVLFDVAAELEPKVDVELALSSESGVTGPHSSKPLDNIT